jgi:hypothetical protein
MLSLSESLPREPVFDRTLFHIDTTPVPMPAFDDYVFKAQGIARAHANLRAKREQQQSVAGSMKQDLALLGDPAGLMQEERRLRDTLASQGL